MMGSARPRAARASPVATTAGQSPATTPRREAPAALPAKLRPAKKKKKKGLQAKKVAKRAKKASPKRLAAVLVERMTPIVLRIIISCAGRA
jgi:hypothetical protein